MVPEDSVVPSLVVCLLFVAALMLSGASGTAASLLLLALAALGTLSVFLRLERLLANHLVRAVIAVSFPAVFLPFTVVRGGWWQVPGVAVLLVYAWLAVEQLLIWVADGGSPGSTYWSALDLTWLSTVRSTAVAGAFFLGGALGVGGAS